MDRTARDCRAGGQLHHHGPVPGRCQLCRDPGQRRDLRRADGQPGGDHDGRHPGDGSSSRPASRRRSRPPSPRAAGTPPDGSVQFLVNGANYGNPVTLSGGTAQLVHHRAAGQLHHHGPVHRRRGQLRLQPGLGGLELDGCQPDHRHDDHIAIERGPFEARRLRHLHRDGQLRRRGTSHPRGPSSSRSTASRSAIPSLWRMASPRSTTTRAGRRRPPCHDGLHQRQRPVQHQRRDALRRPGGQHGRRDGRPDRGPLDLDLWPVGHLHHHGRRGYDGVARTERHGDPLRRLDQPG